MPKYKWLNGPNVNIPTANAWTRVYEKWEMKMGWFFKHQSQLTAAPRKDSRTYALLRPFVIEEACGDGLRPSPVTVPYNRCLSNKLLLSNVQSIDTTNKVILMMAPHHTLLRYNLFLGRKNPLSTSQSLYIFYPVSLFAHLLCDIASSMRQLLWPTVNNI